MQNIFKEPGIRFSIEAGLLKVVGLKNLSENQAEKIRQNIRENKKDIMQALKCLARCRRTGDCYARAYFEGKPGQFPGPPCKPGNCERKNF